MYRLFQYHPVLIVACVIGCSSIAGIAQAQVIPDTTLPNNTEVTPAGNIIQIDGGTTSGSNLFHSFKEFSVPANIETFFNNSANIQNIFSRVTGSNISNIEGLIRANGTANLFLLNPNGIIFGRNARLNIGGSFTGTTADSIQFADGNVFSAKNPQSSPVLTVNVPIGLQFGSNPGAIVNQSRPDSSTAPLTGGLQVKAGQTLALVGGDVIFPGGSASASGGEVHLGAVQSPGTVSLTPIATGWNFGYTGITQFGTIDLASATLNTSGIGGGAIAMRGETVNIREGSSVVADTLGDQNGRGIEIQAAQFNLLDSSISTTTLGAGKGGDLTVRASQTTQIAGSNPLAFASLSSDTAGAGAGGNLTVETGNFQLQGAAFLSASTYDAGTGGNLTVRATDSAVFVGTGFDTMELLIGAAILGQFSPTNRIGGMFSVASGTGTGGNMAIETNSLIMQNGALMFSPAKTQGDSGKIDIQAASSVNLVASGILTAPGPGSSGSTGNVTVNTGTLTIRDGAILSSATIGSGSAGDVIVKASESVEVSTTIPGALLATGITNTSFFGTGAGGDIEIDTKRVVNQAGGLIVANSGGVIGTGIITTGGPGGDVVINASESIEIKGVSADGRITSGPGTTTFTASPAGNLTMNSPNIRISDGAIVSSATLGSGNGGTITINASELLELAGRAAITGLPATLVTSSGRADLLQFGGLAGEDSQIDPRSVTGAGGDLQINARSVVVRDGAALDVRSFATGDAGTLDINAQSVRLDRQGTLNAATAMGAGGNIQIRTQDLQLRQGSRITTDAGNTDGGNITLGTKTLVALENSDITANAQEGFGGRVSITSQGIFGIQFRDALTPQSDITATSNLGPQFTGTVEINTPDVDPASGLIELPVRPTDPTTQISAGCAKQGNSFTITGRGGLPSDPTQTLIGKAVWHDLRPVGELGSQEAREQGSITEVSVSNPASSLVEATGWTVNAKGQVELVAKAANVTLSSSWNQPANCND
ncbi:filamentous hemagglutinin N-terminal domain-containing protein [Microcoleus sp. FACHB-68]|uniref:two-partner secretion domain-containing protein n=1 Tax=Microcoleus sp. FACHB-68 TaxID=2692826 RepID=UPI0016828400|nr:filamentous hemagglutinin N-terminal domain-containing protein [Microcoleus sp. FACHB-68]MBD1938105.1 filamentous hemagglutinin N-terminal domain-containing protein [Microcoleus sp. FACHB-68]